MSVPIRLDQIVKTYKAARGETRAVDGVSLDIEAGELFFLLGPSGCGKTTLLRMIAGFIDPTGGRIHFGDREVTKVEPNKRNTGMVFQSYALWPHMSVEQNVAFGLGLRKVSAKEKAQRVADALDAVQMGAYGSRKPTELSGGQQQRVALARALVVRPDVLLLDEPLSNLDAKLRNELRVEIRRVCKSAGITGVYVTHDQKEALSMADRIAILRDGKVVQVGAPVELYRNPHSRFAAEFLGETNQIAGRLMSKAEGEAHVETAAGTLVSSHQSVERFEVGASVMCSVRPETFGIGAGGSTGGNTLQGEIRETVYLGETAPHEMELPGSVRVHAAELNPSQLRASGEHGEASSVTVHIATDDVVLLPE